VAPSLSQNCNGNANTRSLCIVELHVTGDSIKILNVAQNSFYDELMAPAKIKREFGLHVKCSLLLSDFNQTWSLLRKIFIKAPSVKFHVNLSSGTLADPRGQTDTLFVTMLTRLKIYHYANRVTWYGSIFVESFSHWDGRWPIFSLTLQWLIRHNYLQAGEIWQGDGQRWVANNEKAKLHLLSGITEKYWQYFIQINKLLQGTSPLKTTVGQTDTLPRFWHVSWI
jgi:hypothetical protein